MRGALLSAWLLAGLCVVSERAAPATSTDKTLGAADITVEYQYPHLTVRVGHPTNLLIVLEEVCQRTNAICELGPELSEVILEPITVQGAWVEVVRQLLEGTHFDLAAITPSPQQAGKLFVRRSLPARAAEKLPAQIKVRGDRGRASSPVGATPVDADQEPQTQQMSTPEDVDDVSQRQNGVAAPKTAAGPPASVGKMVSPLTEPAGTSNEDQARTTLQAIHDLYVGPPSGSLPSPPPGMAILPFPDENGNPVFVQITNQPITTLPFPDSLGRPIPVAPGVPGLKVQNPFPPTIGPK